MKISTFTVAAVFSSYAYSSCPLDQYTNYLQAMNESYQEAASKMSKTDATNYALVKEFVYFHIESNNLKIYSAKKLESLGSDLVDTSGVIAKFIKQQKSHLPDGSLVSSEALQLKDDPHYQKAKNDLQYFNSFYLFGFNLEGSERERWNEFSKAREVFNTYLEKTKGMSTVQTAFSKKIKAVCNL